MTTRFLNLVTYMDSGSGEKKYQLFENENPFKTGFMSRFEVSEALLQEHQKSGLSIRLFTHSEILKPVKYGRGKE